jgi:AcrR family transcriptional regulator
MARPRAFEEGDVLDRAADVFGRHGYSGSTMVELTSAMGLNAPSIYAAFGNKRGLFDAVLRRCAAREDGHWAWALSAPTAREVVERLLTGSGRAQQDQAPSSIPIQASLLAGKENADLRAELHRYRQVVEGKLRDRFEEAKRAGDLPADADASKLASYVTAVHDGIAMKAAAGVPPTDVGVAAEQALSAWKVISEVASAASCAGRHPVPDPDDGHRRRRRFGADAALDAAMKVFWTKGFTGASLSDLTEAMGITRPSLYAVFGNKEELFFKALDLYESLRKDRIFEALAAPTAGGVFEALLEHTLRQQLAHDQPRGCLMVLNAMPAGAEAELVRSEVLKRLAVGHHLLVERFERAKVEGDLLPDVNVDGLARFVQALVNGLITQGAAGASESELRALVESSLTMWTASKSTDR